MIYIHFCKTCNHIHMLNGHKTSCPKCSHSLVELQITYREYISMDDRTARYIFFSFYSFIEGLLQDIFEVKIDLTARQVMEFP